MQTPSISELLAQGYRCVSRNHGIVARLDRPDWLAYLEREMGRDLSDDGQWEDHYRRVYSKDTITFGGAGLPRNFPSSSGSHVGYVPKVGDPAPELRTWRDRAIQAEEELAEVRFALAHCRQVRRARPTWLWSFLAPAGMVLGLVAGWLVWGPK